MPSGKMLADLTFDEVHSHYPFSVTTAQTETERILAARLAELGVPVERGVELLSFDQDDTTGAFTTASGTPTARPRTARRVGSSAPTAATAPCGR